MTYDMICIGMALVDSIIKGLNPEPVSASGYGGSAITSNLELQSPPLLVCNFLRFYYATITDCGADGGEPGGFQEI